MRQMLCVIALAAGLLPLTLRAQAPAPIFEVATIRPSGADGPPMSLQRQPGGRLVTSNTPLAFLVSWAFNLDGGRLLGVPKGADSARFDITAKAPTDNLVAGQTQLMMRRLLADRFGLVVHSEMRDLTAYALVVDGS